MSAGGKLTCLHCKAATNGVVLCKRCQTTLGVALQNVTSYHADLFGLGAPEQVRGRRRGEPMDPTGNAVSRTQAGNPIEIAAAETTTMLSTWVRVLLEDRLELTWPADSVPAMAGFLGKNLRSIAVLGWAGEFVREVLGFERRLKRIVSSNQGSWHAGICGAPTGDPLTRTVDDWCPNDLYVHPAETFIRCTSCGAWWSVEERRAHVLDQARESLLPVAVIARAVVMLLGDEPSQQRLEARLRKWVERKVLDDYGVRVLDGVPRRVYRLGDVIDRLTTEASGIPA